MTGSDCFGRPSPALQRMPCESPPRKRRRTSTEPWTINADQHGHQLPKAIWGGFAAYPNCRCPLTSAGASVSAGRHEEIQMEGNADGDGQLDTPSIQTEISELSSLGGKCEPHVFRQLGGQDEECHLAAAIPETTANLPVAEPAHAATGNGMLGCSLSLAQIPPWPATTDTGMLSGPGPDRPLFELPTSIDFGRGMDTAMPTFRDIGAPFLPLFPLPLGFSSIPNESHHDSNLNTNHITVYSFTPEDALPVDDPMRNYDVSDFIDKWRLRSAADARMPGCHVGRKPTLKALERQDYVSRKDISTAPWDAQGIHWRVLGLDRNEAFKARANMHPSTLTYESRFSTTSASPRPSSLAIEESMYHFRSFLGNHRVRINHYQLRNNLVASSRNDIFFTAHDSIVRTSLACPSYFQTAMDLSRSNGAFRPSCLAVASNSSQAQYHQHTVLITGDVNGGYALRNLESDHAHVEGIVSHAEDGLVTHVETFHERRNGLPMAAFSTNDGQLRVMDIGASQFLLSVKGEESINCSAIAPDGRLRATVGDSNDVSITDAERGCTLRKLRHHTNFGFACAWSPDGRHMATGAQDGRIAIWDARNWSQPVHCRERIMSCASSLHFAEDGNLVVAESDDIVSIYDPHGFERVQDLHFLGAIAGVALIDGGAEVVVANADQTVGGLLAYDRVVMASKGCYGSRRRDSCNVELEFGCPW